MTRVAVIVPWRDKGDSHRRLSRQRVEEFLDQPMPFRVRSVGFVSDGREGNEPFNRQAAYNAGIALEPNADVYVFWEADMIVPFGQIEQAVQMADDEPGLVVPFSWWSELSEADAIHCWAGHDPWEYEPARTMGPRRSIGAVNVVSAETMRLVGQWPENASGHGFDDNICARMFEVATGNPTRFTEGTAWALWHPPAYSPWGARHRDPSADPANYSAADVSATEENRRLLHVYEAATTREQILALTSGVIPDKLMEFYR